MSSGREAMRRNYELRASAREQLTGNWVNCVIVSIIYVVIMSLASIPVVGLILQGPLMLGVSVFYLKFSRREQPLIDSMFDGFRNFIPSMVLGLLIMVFTFLWSLLFIIPGIIAALSYSQAYYIMIDNPGIDALEALRRSKHMMYGYKGKLFMLYLSFIGWAILAAFTLGIGYLWLWPYIHTTTANFYNDLKQAG